MPIFFQDFFLFAVISLRYSGYLTSTEIRQLSFFEKTTGSSHFLSPNGEDSNNKQISFVPKKKIGMLVFETLKNKKSDFLNSNTCQCSRLYSSCENSLTAKEYCANFYKCSSFVLAPLYLHIKLCSVRPSRPINGGGRPG